MVASSGQYYSPYVDMTLDAPYNNLTTISSNSGITSFTLAFIQNSGVDSSTHVPRIGWGGLNSLPITNDDGITAEVQGLQADGGTVTIAFGGQAGTDPAVAANTYYNYLVNTVHQSATTAKDNAVAMLQGQYQSVIDHYDVSNLDFDIEGKASVNNVNADHLRNVAIKNLEDANPSLKVSFTLATGASGLANDDNGNVLDLLTYADDDHVRVDVLNIMAMDYDDGVNTSMATKAETAAAGAHQQLIDAGFLSTKIGITAMIGLNDDISETFSLANATALESWAAQQSWVAGFGIWSMARDNGSAAGHTSAPEDTGSGVTQDPYEFSSILNQITGTTPPPTDQTFVGTSATQTFAGTSAGSDTVDYSHATSGVTVDLAKTTAQTPGGGMGSDTLTSIENLIGSGLADHLYGNSSVNHLDGGVGNDVLDGKGGADVMTGGAGNDTYYVDSASDKIVEGAGDITDKVYASVNYKLAADAQVDYMYANVTTGVTLTGNAYSHHMYGNDGADQLIGGTGDDVLDGKGGADIMKGGLGADTYYVDNAGDQITEVSTGSSTDRVHATHDYVLQPTVQVEYLYADLTTGMTLTGNGYSHHIYGNSGGDHLNGGNGADIIDGKAGADTMAGGGGNDTYFVDNASDVVNEGASGGTDKVEALVNYTLTAGSQIELLYADAGSTGLMLTGNELNNSIFGGAGNDTIAGGTGHDILTGGGGDDTFMFKAVSDSPATSGAYDVIKDFVQGHDHIDLTAIDANLGMAGNQQFNFVGSGPLAHAGDLRAGPNSTNTATIITGDINGDHKADFEISITGVMTLHTDDFVHI